MKRIAYIEIDTHAEIAVNFMELMKDSKEFSVDFYFNDKILKINSLERYKQVFLIKKEALFQELIHKKYDLVVIGTAHRNFNLYLKIAQQFNTAIVLHNLNFANASNINLIKSIVKEEAVYRLKLLFKEGLLFKNSLLKNARNLLVLDAHLVGENQFLFLPMFYVQNFQNMDNKVIKVAIPGNVSQKRRDYFHLAKKIKTIKTPMNFVFLGKAKGDELSLLKTLKKELPSHIQIKFFEEKVPQYIFDEEMKSADLLWCPIKKSTTFFSQKETYGETKITGNIGDAIKYQKIAIFPKYFKNDTPFIFHEEEIIEAQILELAKLDSSSYFNSLSKNVVKYKLERVLRQLL